MNEGGSNADIFYVVAGGIPQSAGILGSMRTSSGVRERSRASGDEPKVRKVRFEAGTSQIGQLHGDVPDATQAADGM